MLEIKCSNIDIVKITRVLISHKIQAKIEKNKILLEGDISQEALELVCDNVEILSVQNYINTGNIGYVPKVHRGDIIWVDFGTPFDTEIGGVRPAIVVSCCINNNIQVVPCTSTIKNNIPERLAFNQSDIIAKPEFLKNFHLSNALCDQLTYVSKSRIKKCIGKMTSDFMKKLEIKLIEILELENTKNEG